MLKDTWKFPWTLSVKNFLYTLNFIGYVEISMAHLGKNIFELVSMLPDTWKFLWTLLVRISELVSKLQDTWKFP